MSIRMIPMAFVFNRFPRMLRDLATRLGKDIELKTVGEATELDKGLIEKIIDPLTHLVRNSADHGSRRRRCGLRPVKQQTEPSRFRRPIGRLDPDRSARRRRRFEARPHPCQGQGARPRSTRRHDRR